MIRTGNARASVREPRELFHLVDMVNWPWVQAEGLRSAASLIKGAMDAEAAQALMRKHRSVATVLPDGRRLRDQAPMPPQALQRCLDGGLSPEDWYATVNAQVFFWASLERMASHRRANRYRAQVVLVIDAEALFERYGARAAVTPFNTGFAMRNASSRGLRTFVPLARWRQSGWADETPPSSNRSRPSAHGIAEVAIACDIPDVRLYCREVRTFAPQALYP